jgi:hypothetical protein
MADGAATASASTRPPRAPFVPPGQAPPPVERTEVLAAIAGGCSPRLAAQVLGCAERLVADRLQHAHERLGAHTTAEAVAICCLDGRLTAERIAPWRGQALRWRVARALEAAAARAAADAEAAEAWECRR